MIFAKFSKICGRNNLLMFFPNLFSYIFVRFRNLKHKEYNGYNSVLKRTDIFEMFSVFAVKQTHE